MVRTSLRLRRISLSLGTSYNPPVKFGASQGFERRYCLMTLNKIPPGVPYPSPINELMPLYLES